MENILSNIQEVLGVPAFLINQITFLPDYIKDALITSINFIPWLYFLYFAIELLERYFMKNIGVLIGFIRRLGPIFGSVISIIPECGYQVIASTFYSRKMMTRGTLLAFFVACSDDALPLLFMDMSKAVVIIPIIIIKIIAGIIAAYTVDLLFAFQQKKTENINAINLDLNEPACCHHRIMSVEHPPYWWTHPLTHTFNMFMFTFLCLAFINCVILGFGNVENLASFLMIDSPLQVVGGAIFGLIPNCVTSVFLALAYIKGIMSFPTFLAGLVTTTGLGLSALTKHNSSNSDSTLITVLLLIAGIVTGLIVFYNMQLVSIIQEFVK
ncbi:arsenic efflux protein [bacterium]|nr:arsenic efflux protein [bacterium]